MKEYTRFSGSASLALIGRWEKKMGIWKQVEERVKIAQKTVRYAPSVKLKEAWVSILNGGQGVVQVNTTLRADEALQGAFGLTGCAEQSTISRTLSSCTAETVEQLREANKQLVRSHSRSYRHAYAEGYQVIDVDITGLLGGRQGEGVTKGYFSEVKNRRGRQVGRVYATLYDEVILDRLYPGTVQLEVSFQPLVEQAEDILELDEERRKHTLLRVDGGGGRDADVNWALARGYWIILKVKSWQRSHKLIQSVKQWYPDPGRPGRALGWIEPPFAYVTPTRQLALREERASGKVYEAVIVTNLPENFFRPDSPAPDPQQLLAAIMHFYDQRSGGVETSYRNSKSGLGLNQRNKRAFAAQEMLVLLAQLAYNLLSWVHFRLALGQSTFQPFGWQRLVRDLFHIPGRITFSRQGEILAISLSRLHCLAPPLLLALPALLPGDDLPVRLRKI